MAKQKVQVAGVDGCKGGWLVGIFCMENGKYKEGNFIVAENFETVLSKTANCDLVCIDIPIGLSENENPRKCDVEARKILAVPRASSVFPPPVRQCLSAKNYEDACDISLKIKGKKLSKQSFFIMDKIRQVDELMTPALQEKIREVHPEVSFWALNNEKPMRLAKKKLTGCQERINLLRAEFANVAEEAAKKPEGAAADDVLDVFVAGWTAAQILRQKVRTLPEKPEIDSKGLRMEIVYPA